MAGLIKGRGALPFVLGVLALALAVTGGALAAGGGKTITVCVHKKGGALYQAKKCSKHDSKLSWNDLASPVRSCGWFGTGV